MMITLARLVDAAHRDLIPYRPVPLPRIELTGVHVSELEDPTMFLLGGELLLTVGIPLQRGDGPLRAEVCKRYVQRLVEGRVAALGLGLGSGHSAVPDELLDACEDAGLPLLIVPRESPFLAVSRAYWELVRRGGEAELTALMGLQTALTRAATEEACEREIVRALSRAFGTWVAYMPKGDAEPSTASSRESGLPSGLLKELAYKSATLRNSGRGATCSVQLSSGMAAALYPLSSGSEDAGYLVLGRAGQLSEPERHLFLTASTLLGARAAIKSQAAAERRRLEGMLLALVLEGHDDAARFLASKSRSDPLPERAFLAALLPSTGTAPTTPPDGLVLESPEWVFVVQPAAGTRPKLPYGVQGAWVGPLPLRRLHEVASRVAEVATTAHPGQVIHIGQGVDLPADEWVTQLEARSSEILETVRAYLASRGQWEAAGRLLGIHRNSVRYRIGQASDLLGVDLNDPDVAAQLWLALRKTGGPA